MSEALQKIKNYRKQVLTDLYNQCSKAEQDLFNRMYGSLEKISDEKIDLAIQQCERTIGRKIDVKEKARDEFHRTREDDKDFAEQWDEGDFEDWFRDVYLESENIPRL